MGLRLAPASLPSHSTMLLHTLHKNICGFRHGVMLTERASQSASSRRMGDTTPCSCCRSSPLLFGVAFIRRSFHASPQRPARRRRPPPTPPAIRPMSMALSGGSEGGEGGAWQVETVPRTPMRVVAQEQTVAPQQPSTKTLGPCARSARSQWSLRC
jgi:hypothetical protein